MSEGLGFAGLRAFSWVVLANLLRQVAFALVNGILFYRLSRSTFGALALAFGYMTVFAGLGEFGIRQIGWREVARHPRKATRLASIFLSAKTVTVGVALVGYWLLMPVLWDAELDRSIYLLYGLGIVFNGGTFDYPLFGLNRIDLFAKFSAMTFAVYLLGCVVLVTDDRQAWLVPTIFGVSMILLFLLEVWWFKVEHGSVGLRLRRGEFVCIVREAWPLGVGEALNRLALTYPLILIGMAVGIEGVGNYRIAEIGYSFLAQFGHMFAVAGFSRLSHLYHHRPSELPSVVLRTFALTMIAAVTVGTLFSCLGPLGFELVFGEIANETAAVLQVLGVALIFSTAVRFLKTVLPSVDKEDALVGVNALGMLIGASVSWLTIPLWGITGVAIGVAFAELTTLVVLVAVYWKILGKVSRDEGR